MTVYCDGKNQFKEILCEITSLHANRCRVGVPELRAARGLTLYFHLRQALVPPLYIYEDNARSHMVEFRSLISQSLIYSDNVLSVC